MNHPPIPPELVKSGIFCEFGPDVGWCFKPQGSGVWEPLELLRNRLKHRFPFSLDIRHGMEISALCEQFWRRRAERWGKVLLSIPYDDGFRQRNETAIRCQDRCVDNADAWRAWGEGK